MRVTTRARRHCVQEIAWRPRDARSGLKIRRKEARDIGRAVKRFRSDSDAIGTIV